MLDFNEEYALLYCVSPLFAESESTMNKRLMFYSYNKYTVGKYSRWWNNETPRNFWYMEDKHFDDMREKASLVSITEVN